MRKKTFLISIDAEGDNFWEWLPGDPITTRNAEYVARFQLLCDKYGFRPTYLTNYEMACDRRFVELVAPAILDGRCEIGMHLHAWNTPPLYDLPIREDIRPGECAYLIEYPTKIMEEKIRFMTEFLEKTFGTRPVVHRAGRWATDERYLQLLSKYGYLADCSVAPGMNMQRSKGFTVGSAGTNYEGFPQLPYIIRGTSLLEIPMTVRTNHYIKKTNSLNPRRFLRNLVRAIKGRGMIWLRPDGDNLNEMKYLARTVARSKSDYLMLMLHTSEMMPGGSPVFKTEEGIEKMYADLDCLFAYISNYYIGDTIGGYASKVLSLNSKIKCTVNDGERKPYDE